MPRKMTNRNEIVDERLSRVEEGLELVKGGMEEMKKILMALLDKKMMVDSLLAVMRVRSNL